MQLRVAGPVVLVEVGDTDSVGHALVDRAEVFEDFANYSAGITGDVSDTFLSSLLGEDWKLWVGGGVVLLALLWLMAESDGDLFGGAAA